MEFLKAGILTIILIVVIGVVNAFTVGFAELKITDHNSNPVSDVSIQLVKNGGTAEFGKNSTLRKIYKH